MTAEATVVEILFPVAAALARIQAREARLEARRRPRRPARRHITWYYSGHSPEEIARLWNVPIKAVRSGLAMVRAYEDWLGLRVYSSLLPPLLEPLFGCQPLVPNGPCPHDDRHLSVENRFNCEYCNRSFWDEHPLFWPSVDDPAPVVKLPPPPPEILTRKQRREREHSKKPKILLAVAQEVAPITDENPSPETESCPTL